MSALSEASTPANDPQSHPPNIDPNIHGNPIDSASPPSDAASRQKPRRSSPIPRIRRACAACHAGKTRCSEVLPCQSCLKRGIGASCVYPDPDANGDGLSAAAGGSNVTPNSAPYVSSNIYSQLPAMPQSYYYDYSMGNTSASFRSSKRPRNLTEDEAAAITRNFQRGDFYVGTSAPVRIDPRLPVRLTLGEGDHVHFTVGEAMV